MSLLEEVPPASLFARALRGEPCTVTGLGVEMPLPVGRWTRVAAEDRLLLDLCRGATLDIGCGPGRLTAALSRRGHVTLGIDVVPEAVERTWRRGGAALCRDVFEPVPAEGRWETALLADGNIGIGGDPAALLGRARQLVRDRGRVVVEVAAPGVATTRGAAALLCGGQRSLPFQWAVVGADAIDDLAEAAGFASTTVTGRGERWCAVLEAS